MRCPAIFALCGVLAGCGSSRGADAGRDATAPDGDPDAGGDRDAAADLPDTGTDDAAPTEGGPPCGNGRLDPGETCEVPGVACQDCRFTTFASCLNVDVPWPCDGLGGQSLFQCEALVECAVKMYQQSALFAQCTISPALDCQLPRADQPFCYCSDETCSQGADRACAPAFQAVAGSTDSAEVLRQIKDPTTTLHRVEAWLVNASCSARCQDKIRNPLNTFHGGTSFIINEINHVPGGSDPGEFIEIFNGTGGPVDFAGQDLVGFNGGARALTVSLDGVVPNGGYLVIGSASVPVPLGVRKIDLPPGADAIPDSNLFAIVFLPSGAPDPNPVPKPSTVFVDADPDGPAGGNQEGSACLFPNGTDRWDLGSPSIYCATATPGTPNFQ